MRVLVLGTWDFDSSAGQWFVIWNIITSSSEQRYSADKLANSSAKLLKSHERQALYDISQNRDDCHARLPCSVTTHGFRGTKQLISVPERLAAHTGTRHSRAAASDRRTNIRVLHYLEAGLATEQAEM